MSLAETVRHLLGPNYFGTLVAGAFGAFAGAYATSRRETKAAIVAQLNSVSAARALCFSICNRYLALKRQHVRPTWDQYCLGRQRLLDAQQAFRAGDRLRVLEYQADLRTIQHVWVPTQTLERQVFEKTSIRGRGLAAAVDLIGAIDSLAKALDARDNLIEEIRSKSPVPRHELAATYFGLAVDGVTDDRFRSNMEGIYRITDDCIFFSQILADDLFEYGQRLRRRYAWRYRLGVPKLKPEDWGFARNEGLLPDHQEYANWLRGFVRAPSRVTRFRDWLTKHFK